jgi:hypothetical protein
MNSNNEATNRRKKDKHFSVSNSDYQDQKEGGGEEEQQESAKTTTTAIIDITKAGNTSKDILDIIETPDVATWNKETQTKGNAADIIKRSQERGRGEGIERIAKGKITTTNTTTTSTTIGLKEKGSEGLTIDPANKEDIAKVVKSGRSLTDKAEESFSMSDNNLPDTSIKKDTKAK